jgi:hypothetical protein
LQLSNTIYFNNNKAKQSKAKQSKAVSIAYLSSISSLNIHQCRVIKAMFNQLYRYSVMKEYAELAAKQPHTIFLRNIILIAYFKTDGVASLYKKVRIV